MATFKDLMDGFGVVTVMNACIYKLRAGKAYVGKAACPHAESAGGALTPGDFYCTGLYLDTLKIANFTQEGPTKTVTGGQYANPLIKYGKTMTCEMQDALGRAATLVEFFGCEYVEGRLSVTDKFPGAFAIEGDSFFIDQGTGEKVPVHIFIPQFLPEAILTLTQDAEGDATVFDLNGSVNVTKITDAPGGTARDIFYEIRDTSFFNAETSLPTAADLEGGNHDWHEPEDMTPDAKAAHTLAVAKEAAKASVVAQVQAYNALKADNEAEEVVPDMTSIDNAGSTAAVKTALDTLLDAIPKVGA